jgi:transcriptional regulator with XRE-family HTH domain
MTETAEKPRKKHVGRNLQKVRVYLGFKQDALAADLNMSQQAISKIEQQEEIEEELLGRIAKVLGVSSELIKDFDEERTIYNINSNNYRDATISEGATANAISQQVNPIDKIVELYERLLKSEREKIDILLESKR